MPTRSIVIFSGDGETSPAVLLSWVGEPRSPHRFPAVYHSIEEMEYREVPPNPRYEVARYIQLVSEFLEEDDDPYRVEDGMRVVTRHDGGRLQPIEGLSRLTLLVINGPGEISAGSLAQFPVDSSDDGIWVIDRSRWGKWPWHAVRRFSRDAGGLGEWSPEKVHEEFVASHRFSTKRRGELLDEIKESFGFEQ